LPAKFCNFRQANMCGKFGAKLVGSGLISECKCFSHFENMSNPDPL
jgi:hypothetical protein